jgi:hypothetical protein
VELAKCALADQPACQSLPGTLWHCADRLKFGTRAFDLARSLRKEADVNVLLGLLALEEGAADVAFRLALSLLGDEEAAAAGRGLDFNGRRTAQECLQWLK